jgi:hypothetical protein
MGIAILVRFANTLAIEYSAKEDNDFEHQISTDYAAIDPNAISEMHIAFDANDGVKKSRGETSLRHFYQLGTHRRAYRHSLEQRSGLANPRTSTQSNF